MRYSWSHRLELTLTNLEIVDDEAAGKTLLVGHGGYATIREAIDATSAGDVIYVAPGTYNETVTVDKDLTIRGANYGEEANWAVTVHARGPETEITGGVNVTADGVTLDGLKTSGSTRYRTYPFPAGANVDADDVTLSTQCSTFQPKRRKSLRACWSAVSPGSISATTGSPAILSAYMSARVKPKAPSTTTCSRRQQRSERADRHGERRQQRDQQVRFRPLLCPAGGGSAQVLPLASLCRCLPGPALDLNFAARAGRVRQSFQRREDIAPRSP